MSARRIRESSENGGARHGGQQRGAVEPHQFRGTKVPERSQDGRDRADDKEVIRIREEAETGRHDHPPMPPTNLAFIQRR
jgi:hypothetical protein